jgi:micrococcal nuclease
MTRTLVAAALCLALTCLPGRAETFDMKAVLSGNADVKDGDGVLFGRVEVRLQGIAAPEDGRNVEAGGPESTENLRRLVEGQLVVCHLDGTVAGSSNRPAGICYIGSIDIGRHQVEAGHARDCPAYSGGRYAEAEAAAHASGKDLASIYGLPDYC